MNIELTKEQLELAINCVKAFRANLKKSLECQDYSNYETVIRPEINKLSLLLGSLENQRGDV